MKTHTSQRPGGRTARNTAAVHQAVQELISAADGVAPSASQIAERAGVSTATIYRRWGSVDAVVLDAALEALGVTVPPTSTGTQQERLLAYAEHTAQGASAPGGLSYIKTVIAACGGDHDGRGLEHVRRRGLEIEQVLLAPFDGGRVTVQDVLDGIIAPIYFRVAFDIGGMNPEYLRGLVKRLLASPQSVAD